MVIAGSVTVEGHASANATIAISRYGLEITGGVADVVLDGDIVLKSSSFEIFVGREDVTPLAEPGTSFRFAIQGAVSVAGSDITASMFLDRDDSGNFLWTVVAGFKGGFKLTTMASELAERSWIYHSVTGLTLATVCSATSSSFELAVRLATSRQMSMKSGTVFSGPKPGTPARLDGIDSGIESAQKAVHDAQTQVDTAEAAYEAKLSAATNALSVEMGDAREIKMLLDKTATEAQEALDAFVPTAQENLQAARDVSVQKIQEAQQAVQDAQATAGRDIDSHLQHLKKAKDDMNKQFEDAISNVQSAQRGVDSLQGQVNDAQRSLDDAQQALDNASWWEKIPKLSAPHPTTSTSDALHYAIVPGKMPKPLQHEDRIQLALEALRSGQIKIIRKAADAFGVPKSTLHRRVKGGGTRQEAQVKNRKLRPTEEAALIQWIESLDDRGMSPTIGYIRQMADLLLRERGGFTLLDASLTSTPVPAMTVGENWVQRLLHRHPHLETKYSRKYDYQRALCEDPEKISAWFARVQRTINEYGVLDSDIYNFDETGFQMGVASTSKVVTRSDRRNRPVVIQPGNREWTTVIECINASGWSVDPMIIFEGKVHISSWYDGSVLPKTWRIGVSDNGWTTDELTFEWLREVFEPQLENGLLVDIGFSFSMVMEAIRRLHSTNSVLSIGSLQSVCLRTRRTTSSPLTLAVSLCLSGRTATLSKRR
ncbi:hypothetical protein CHGG_08384 [Chaetomium globosum CBS 148.51]|uniref:HTH CENPB-type domain-containing protein n=1 Tax=Chaetomium globosum (strain ATCC 6205 / CBS 148.51 / DSM 1962 / NBRC 6347 / NRRL 1970) TaxID=306901 RepID=Q2GUH0_CHAGB|nr:uncharacterized protein CHGG_08384 [Chaetomium globosum CBS 148.51]EAQ84370.1 hypothetical protein CHGG_08384 [Chaetomium globosum CBS 148.51]